MTNGKKMYKVLVPLERKGGGGGTYWMRVGTGFTNRDDSLNLYLDAIPPTNAKSNRYELHIREFSEEDLRKRESYAQQNQNHTSTNASGGYGATSSGSLSRDLGGVGGIGGGGPMHATASSASTRAVTAGGPDGEDVPF